MHICSFFKYPHTLNVVFAFPPSGQVWKHRGGAVPVPGRGQDRRKEPGGRGGRGLRQGPGTRLPR